jgi:hypothetical protein
MKKFPVSAGPAGVPAGLAEADGAGVRLPLKVAVTLAPGATEAPGTAGAPGMVAPGAGLATPVVVPGAGFTGAPGAGFVTGAPGAGLTGTVVIAGAGFAGVIAVFGGGGEGGWGGWVPGRFCANAPRANMVRQRVVSVFISAAICFR